MKLTKSKLKEIIREVITETEAEGYDDPDVKWDFSGIHYTRGGPWIDNMDYTNIANLETYNRIKDRYQNDSST